MKEPVQVKHPRSDRPIIFLRAEMLRECVLFTPLGDILLDLGHGPAIEGLVSKPLWVGIAGSTHVVNCSIALRTDRLGWPTRPHRHRHRLAQVRRS